MIIRLMAWLIFTVVFMAIIAIVGAWVILAFLAFLDPTLLGDLINAALQMVGLGS